MNSPAPPPAVLAAYPLGYGAPNAQPASAPRAARYDLASRQILRDATGALFLQMHPVDQAVGLICGMQKGSIASLPDVGIDYSVLDLQPRTKWAKTLDAEVRRALGSYVTNNDITLDPVTIIPSLLGSAWSLEWTASYLNNRLPKTMRGTRTSISGRY